MKMQDGIPQDSPQELKAERVQKEMAVELAQTLPEEPFRISLKAERVQEPFLLADAGDTVSLAYELTFNQMRNVAVELTEPQIVISLFATGSLRAA